MSACIGEWCVFAVALLYLWIVHVSLSLEQRSYVKFLPLCRYYVYMPFNHYPKWMVFVNIIRAMRFPEMEHGPLKIETNELKKWLNFCAKIMRNVFIIFPFELATTHVSLHVSFKLVKIGCISEIIPGCNRHPEIEFELDKSKWDSMIITLKTIKFIPFHSFYLFDFTFWYLHRFSHAIRILCALPPRGRIHCICVFSVRYICFFNLTKLLLTEFNIDAN